MKLEDAVALFLGEYKPTTQRSYKFVLRDLCENIGPKRDISRINPADLIMHMQCIRERPGIKSPATINKHVKTIKRFFNWCIEIKMIASSPGSALHVKNHRKFIRVEKAMEDDELEKLLEYTKWHPRANALVLFIADTGCRRGGAAGLLWQHIDLDNLKALVTEKGDKSRPVFYGETCREALMSWRKKQAITHGHVFSNRGQKITSESLAQFLRRACIAAGIRSLGPHSLRHRKGHQLADSKTAPSVAATLLGHENVNTTLNYYYPKDYARAEEAARQLMVEQETKVIRLKAGSK